jgi:hypothetical protein
MRRCLCYDWLVEEQIKYVVVAVVEVEEYKTITAITIKVMIDEFFFSFA